MMKSPLASALHASLQARPTLPVAKWTPQTFSLPQGKKGNVGGEGLKLRSYGEK
jgi:hypothetical protein